VGVLGRRSGKFTVRKDSNPSSSYGWAVPWACGHNSKWCYLALLACDLCGSSSGKIGDSGYCCEDCAWTYAQRSSVYGTSHSRVFFCDKLLDLWLNRES